MIDVRCYYWGCSFIINQANSSRTPPVSPIAWTTKQPIWIVDLRSQSLAIWNLPLNKNDQRRRSLVNKTINNILCVGIISFKNVALVKLRMTWFIYCYDRQQPSQETTMFYMCVCMYQNTLITMLNTFITMLEIVFQNNIYLKMY